MVFLEQNHFAVLEFPYLNEVYAASLICHDVVERQPGRHRHLFARFEELERLETRGLPLGREVAEEGHEPVVADVHLAGVQYLVSNEVVGTSGIAASKEGWDVSREEIIKLGFHQFRVFGGGRWAIVFFVASCNCEAKQGHAKHNFRRKNGRFHD